MNRVGARQRGGLRARVVGTEEFSSLRTAWNRLALSAPNPTPFGTWEWASAWLRTIGDEVTMRFVLVESDGVIRGILPLARSMAPRRAFGARVLTLCGADAVGPDQLEPLAAEADVPAILDHAFDEVWSDSHGWDCVRLPMVAEDSPIHSELARRSGVMWSVGRMVSCAPYLPIRGSYEQFLRQLSRTERYRLRSRSRKLLSVPGVSYGDAGFLGHKEALAVLRDLHGRRARAKGIRSSFDIEHVQRFHERLLGLLPQDSVVLRCLRQDSEIFAMFYGFRVAGRVFYFQLGYDPRWSQFSPGLVLLSETIREAFESGCHEYNFLQGGESFKSTWTKSVRRLYDWTVYCPRLRGRLYCGFDRIIEGVRAGIIKGRQAWPRSRLQQPGAMVG